VKQIQGTEEEVEPSSDLAVTRFKIEFEYKKLRQALRPMQMLPRPS
jgi:hypothetical protein